MQKQCMTEHLSQELIKVRKIIGYSDQHLYEEISFIQFLVNDNPHLGPV